MKIFENLLLNILATNSIVNWQSLEYQLSLFEPHISGKIFEAFCKYYYLCDPSVKDDFEQVYYLKDTPLAVQSILNITSDFGIDLILKGVNNTLTAVQCKFTSDSERTLTWGSDKLSHLFAYAERADERIVFTNAYDVVKITQTRDKFSLINNSFLQEMSLETFDIIKDRLQGNTNVKYVKAKPWDFQQEAILNCAIGFETENRGQLIMPCGTGKTLVGLKIKETIDAKTTLVAVPSLWLLRQTKNYWAKDRDQFYDYWCVCSDEYIDDKADQDNYTVQSYETGGRVTNDSEEIRKFLLSESIENKVIFCTFHSLSVIAKAINGTDFQFDFIFCDEAHRTTGADNKQAYGIIHDNVKIPSKKRLYSTATPRVLSAYIKSKASDDFFIFDMNDRNIFGDEFYRMSFKTAIESKRLVDYQIIAVGVNDEQIAQYLSNKSFALEVADNFALDKIMNEYKATHAISFHSTIKKATRFKENHEEHFKEVQTFHINGTHLTSNRKKKLVDFKAADRSVITNVRCLSEGVDVPAIDAVYFCDPKSSKIDIVQSVGRALRTDNPKNKEWGYIVVPIYHQKKDNIEAVVKKSIFNNLINVVRSMYDQDERLQDEINNLIFNQKNRNDFSKTNFLGNNSSLEKIVLVGFEDKLKESLFHEIISKISGWNGWYYLLTEYAKENSGNSNPPYREIFKGEQLGQWAHRQRKHRKVGKLSNRQIEMLNGIQFEWREENVGNERADALKIHLQELEDYFNIHGHSDVPTREPKTEKEKQGWSQGLASFVNRRLRTPKLWPSIVGNNEKTYSYKGQNLPVYKFLEIIQFQKEPKPKSAKRIIEWLKNEREVNPNFSTEEFELLFKGNKKFFVMVRRVRDMYRKCIEGDEQVLNYFEEGEIDTLNNLGFTWGYNLGDVEKERFTELLAYRKSEGTFAVSAVNQRLYHWCKRRKSKTKDSLSLKKMIESEGLSQAWINELKGLGFNID